MSAARQALAVLLVTSVTQPTGAQDIQRSTGVAESAPEPPRISVTLAPATAGNDGEIEWIDVALEVSASEGSVPRLRLPIVVNNVVTAASTLTGLSASDSDGAVLLATEREGPEDSGTLYWKPQRPVTGNLTVRYRVPATSASAARGPAPPLELRRDDGAVSAAGSTFLLLPEGDTAYRLTVRWDLSRLPAGSAGVSSLGSGEAEAATPQSASRLDRSFFMAGRIGRYPANDGAGGFRAAWQGRPPFDVQALMAWTAQLHGRFVHFFRLDDAPLYTVFLRPNPVNAGGGVGLEGSFVATFWNSTNPDDLKFTLAHEMFHTFSPRLATPGGLESSWFSEGLAVHYQRVLPLRFGMITPDEFVADLNDTAARYYTSIMAEVPNSEVPGRFWEDTRIRTLPYDRGALYFAELNHMVKQASGGRRSLDHLMLAMVERQRQGRALGHGDWQELLAAELGQAGIDHFRAMLAGRRPLPPSEAFGPCFRRTTRPLRRYELGFEPKVLTEPRRIVRGLVPGSAAESAGLRNGDEIVRPVPQDAIQGNQTALLRLEVRRGETVMPIAYLPRGETIDAWQWERVADSGDICAI